MMRKTILAAMVALFATAANAQNPYMPLWEHIPDGEPYVFDDPDHPGKKRVYVYGSHDDLRQYYCGKDQVVWSAPVEDLTQWRYDGVCFELSKDAHGKNLNANGDRDVLYAPDITETVENGRKIYYFTPNVQGERKHIICKGYRPDGPFVPCNWNEDGRTGKGVFDFDPAIFRDDDGRVYAYWGFRRSMACELDPTTMCTPKPGTTVIEDMVSGHQQPGIFRFFEASSMRKVMGKNVFIYSRFTEDGEFGLYSSNYNLAYAYSDHPLGPWTYGGTIIDARARGKNEEGKTIPTAVPWGNTHGSLLEIGGRWYVFYHRQTGENEYSRQAMVEPVDIELKDGRLLISEAEVTSQGFRTDGLDPLSRTAAGWACYMTWPSMPSHRFPHLPHTGSYVKATYIGDNGMAGTYSLNDHHAPVADNTAGSTVGYKYFNMDQLGKRREATLRLHLKPTGVEGDIIFLMDSPYLGKGKEVGRLHLDKTDIGQTIAPCGRLGCVERDVKMTGLKGMKGKHALYMLFRSDTKEQSLCELYDFIFF